MTSKLTRRQWAAAVTAASAPRLAAQPPAPAAADLAAQAREQVKRNAAQLAKYQIPVATEPAFHFKA